MPVGDCEKAFVEAARREDLHLIRYKKPWLNQRGHFGLPDRASGVTRTLDEIFLALGGNIAEQTAKRMTALPGDFIHVESGTIIEVDEVQHFTSFRLKSFEYYAPDSPLGFDIEKYREHCRRFGATADKYRQRRRPRRLSALAGGSDSAHTMTPCGIWWCHSWGILPSSGLQSLTAMAGRRSSEAASGYCKPSHKRLIAARFVVLGSSTRFLWRRYSLGYAAARFCWLPIPARRTTAIEVGMQNSGLAAGLARQYLTLEAALPGAIFSVWHNVSGAVITAYWRRSSAAASDKGRRASVAIVE